MLTSSVNCCPLPACVQVAATNASAQHAGEFHKRRCATQLPWSVFRTFQTGYCSS